jgi:hypothetical protein
MGEHTNAMLPASLILLLSIVSRNESTPYLASGMLRRLCLCLM